MLQFKHYKDNYKEYLKGNEITELNGKQKDITVKEVFVYMQGAGALFFRQYQFCKQCNRPY